MKKHIVFMLAGFYTLQACGSAEKQVFRQDQASGSSEQAAQFELNHAEAKAASIDAGSNDGNQSGTPEILIYRIDPDWRQVVEEARAYTRRLLGLDDSALIAYRMKIAEARVQSKDAADFERRIAPARKEFEEKLKLQKDKADAARTEHKVELENIYKATHLVFEACGGTVNLMAGNVNSAGVATSGPINTDPNAPVSIPKDAKPYPMEIRPTVINQGGIPGSTPGSAPTIYPVLAIGNGYFYGRYQDLFGQYTEPAPSQECKDKASLLRKLIK